MTDRVIPDRERALEAEIADLRRQLAEQDSEEDDVPEPYDWTWLKTFGSRAWSVLKGVLVVATIVSILGGAIALFVWDLKNESRKQVHAAKVEASRLKRAPAGQMLRLPRGED